MVDREFNVTEKYLLALRIIQPARVQDIERTIIQIWPSENETRTCETIRAIHKKMLAEGGLISVRRGTYTLDARGMNATGKLMKERDIDNIRLFLMKQQRRRYSRKARWLG